MAETVQYHLSCDWPGCDAQFAGEPSLNPAEVREEATHYGWVFKNGNDLCEDHSDAEQQDEKADREGGEKVRLPQLP